MASRLLPVSGGRPYALSKSAVVIGRRPDCDIHIDDKLISGRHCRLTFEERMWVVTDLESKNGTQVNGKPVRRAPLPPGALPTVARSFVFRIEYSPMAAAKELEKVDPEEVVYGDHARFFQAGDSRHGPPTIAHPETEKEDSKHDIWMG